MKYLVLIILLGGCVSASEVRGNLWQNDGLSLEVCAKYPELREIGVYRVVKCTDTTVHGCENGEQDYEEVIPYCSVRIKNFLSADKVYIEEWLKKATRPGK